MKKYLCVLSLIMLLLTSSAEATITWTQKQDMPTGRDGLGIGVVNDSVYCIGGWTSGSPASATGIVEVYEPVSDTWTSMGSMGTPRGFLAVCVLGDEIYAIGGWNGSSSQLTTVEAYNTVTHTWFLKTPMSIGRDGLGAEVVNGKIYAIGGFHTGRDVVEEYDPGTNSWVSKTSMPGGRFFFASEVINNKIYVAAGRGPSGNYTETWEYDPGADTTGGSPWQIKANIPTTRYHPEAGVVQNMMYVIGGLNGSAFACGSLGEAIRAEVTIVEVYDPSTDTWTTEDPMLFARRELDVGVVDNNLYAIGGWPSPVCAINEEGVVLTSIKEDFSAKAVDHEYGSTIISGNLFVPTDKQFKVFDISGRQVSPQNIKSGIYFIEIEGRITRKIVKIK